MGIVPSFTRQDIERAIRERIRKVDAAIVSRFIYVGETFVNNARMNGKYKDQTGNLRSAICYIVLKDGVKRSPGAIPADSKKMIDVLRLKYATGYVLIVGTGMNYAAAVESKGKDVLTASSITAKKELQKAMKGLKKSLV